ncbi:MAG: sulfurtransferase TusA family protein [Mariprofundaceae bacterium]|nr:sulfurtransferase TusA family protein [Mariprofundaceae bacterium]
MNTFQFAQTTDVDDYEAGLSAFLDGRMAEERFTPFRLQMGVYGQRQEGVQMLRVKLPGGNITPDQLDVIGDCVQTWAGRMDRPKLAHITTRQDIQANFVDLKDTLAFLRKLDDAGLTTREACGNTVRNVSTCFLAGVCPAEHTDVSIHARRFAEYFLRHPLAQQFPRKFKVSFSGCASDCAASGMHDVGLIATRKDGQAGFKVWAAGGLSSQPMPALLLEEFVPEQDILLVAEALMRIHFKFSERKRRARARMKYVAQKLGKEAFIAEYRKQRAVIETIHDGLDAVSATVWRDAPDDCLNIPSSGIVTQHNGDYALLVNVFRGDLTPAQCHAIALAARTAGTARLQITTEQGIIINDVAKDKLDAALLALQAANLTCSHSRGIADAVACPGTETCRLGITSSRGLVEAMKPMLQEFQDDAVLGNIEIKASGCHHSCARHHIADLGFHGLAKKVKGQAVPHYQLHIGGSGRGGEAMAFATDAIPAKHAPEAGIAVLRAYQQQREESETLHGWAERVGRGGVQSILKPFAADEGDVEGLIYDWSENEAFNTKGNKKGECAGAVLSMSDALTAEAEYEHRMARAHLDAMFWNDAGSALRRCGVSTARAFLVAYGETPATDAEVFTTLVHHAADDDAIMNGLNAVQYALMNVDIADPAASMHAINKAVAPWLDLALLRFAAIPIKDPIAVKSNTDVLSSNDPITLDLTGIACPMNFVKTKIKLTGMPLDAELLVILDDGAPIENVPLSLEEQGQTILSKTRISKQQWQIVVKKSSLI